MSNKANEDQEILKAKKSLEEVLSNAQQLRNSVDSTKPLAPNAASALILEAAKKPDNRIYVGALHYDLPVSHVKQLFSSFGTITDIDMAMEPGAARSKGYCFITFESPASAEAALGLNGIEIAGRKVNKFINQN